MDLKVGNEIPDFALQDQNGKEIRIEKASLQKNLVIYFYPKDETAGCTKQACAFRDSYQDFIDAGAEVIGISSDNEESHSNFASHHKLPFILLSDINGEVRKLFGVKANFLGLIPGRSTYIVNKKGIIMYMFSSQLQIAKHIKESLRVLTEM